MEVCYEIQIAPDAGQGEAALDSEVSSMSMVIISCIIFDSCW